MTLYVPRFDDELEGQVALVTGGVGGIGAAVTRRLAAAGAHVVAADIAGGTAQVAKDKVAAWVESGALPESAAERIEGVQLDVTDPAAVQQLADRIGERFGRMDILVNNAGVVSGAPAPVWQTKVENWHRSIGVMLTGPFLMSRSFIPLMLEREYGRIVNVSSMAGKEGNAETAGYSSAKAGLLGLTKVIGKELALTGVLCNAVTPGVVESPMNHKVARELHERALAKIPMGRPGKPEELAELIAYLASPRLGFSTGAVFDFSGGRATY